MESPILPKPPRQGLSKAQLTKETLLKNAKKEFLSHGFQGASLRRICASAGVTTGAVYFFFQNKEDLFSQIVAPTASGLAALGRELTETEYASPDLGPACDLRLMEFLYCHREEALLLLEHSAHTRYETFPGELYAQMRQTFLLFFKRYGREDADPELIRILVEMRMKGFLEILKGDYTMEQALTLTRQTGIYADGGFRQLAATMKTEQPMDKN